MINFYRIRNAFRVPFQPFLRREHVPKLVKTYFLQILSDVFTHLARHDWLALDSRTLLMANKPVINGMEGDSACLFYTIGHRHIGNNRIAITDYRVNTANNQRPFAG